MKSKEISLKTSFKTCYIIVFQTNYQIEGPKLSNFKIRGPFLQNGENKETKTSIKPFFLWLSSLIVRNSFFKDEKVENLKLRSLYISYQLAYKLFTIFNKQSL